MLKERIWNICQNDTIITDPVAIVTSRLFPLCYRNIGVSENGRIVTMDPVEVVVFMFKCNLLYIVNYLAGSCFFEYNHLLFKGILQLVVGCGYGPLDNL